MGFFNKIFKNKIEESGENNYEKPDYYKKSREPVRRVIALANQKGGVGKTTTAVNVSAYLGHYGFKTLMIDLDPQSNSTSGLGVSPDSERNCVYDILISDVNPEEVILGTPYNNLKVIPSSIQLAGAEIELVTRLKREYRLKEAIRRIEDSYDFIIIDCPPALGLLTINALTAAGEVIIPIQCEYYALEGLGQLINTIELVKKNLNEDLIIAGVVMTMYDSRTKLSDQVIEEVKKHFSEKVYEAIIPRNVRLSEAPSYGKPIMLYNPGCKGALAYKSLTEEVIKNGKKGIR